MAQLHNFNAHEVAPLPNFDPIPAGQYAAMIVASEEKTSQNGHRFVTLEFEILEGTYKGRKLWVNLNLYHPNPETVKFVRAELASICLAVGVPAPQDSTQLHNVPVTISVRCVNRKDNGELMNRVKGYASRSAATAPAASPAQATPYGAAQQGAPYGAAPAAQATPPQTPPPQPQATNTTPPWQR